MLLVSSVGSVGNFFGFVARRSVATTPARALKKKQQNTRRVMDIGCVRLNFNSPH